MFIDERATHEQADKLTQVFGGQLGGPMAALAPLVGEMLGVERAAIEVQDDGFRHSVRVGDVIDFEVEDIVPFGVETVSRFGFRACFTRRSDLTIAEAPARDQRLGIETKARPVSRLRVLLGGLRR